MSEDEKPKRTQHNQPGESSRSGESKRDRFKRLAQTRVPRATSAIQSVGKLANKYNYEFEEADAQKIIRHLQNELDDIKRKFLKSTSQKNKFSLD
jgi:hypothetical protein